MAALKDVILEIPYNDSPCAKLFIRNDALFQYAHFI